MAETVEKKARDKRPIDILRERHGGMTKELQEYFKEQNRVRKALSEALKKGPRTVPELAREISLPAERVMWQLMAMKKYGSVVEAGDSGDYVAYAYKEAES
jgi:predicted transcriptional regulator